MKNQNPNDDAMLITPKRASQLTGIGVDTLREISDRKDCDFVVFVKSHRRYRKQQLINYVNNTKYID